MVTIDGSHGEGGGQNYESDHVISCRQRFGGGMTGSSHRDTARSWATTRLARKGMNEFVAKWFSTMLHLPQIHRRLCTVVVDQQDASRCIKQWDTPSSLFYCDPPYVGHEAYYQGGFGEADHERLGEALNAIAGRAVVSYYPCPAVDKLYPATRWHRKAIQVFTSACGNQPRDPHGEPVKAKACQRRTELLLCNFDPATRRRLVAPGSGR